MSLSAALIVNIASLDKSFQYLVPEGLAEQVEIGTAVRIPFGRGMREGYVIGFSNEPKIEPDRIREIDEILTTKVSIESRLIRLAAWLRRTYGSTMQAALSAVLPVRKRTKSRSRIPDFIEEGMEFSEPDLSE